MLVRLSPGSRTLRPARNAWSEAPGERHHRVGVRRNRHAVVHHLVDEARHAGGCRGSGPGSDVSALLWSAWPAAGCPAPWFSAARDGDLVRLAGDAARRSAGSHSRERRPATVLVRLGQSGLDFVWLHPPPGAWPQPGARRGVALASSSHSHWPRSLAPRRPQARPRPPPRRPQRASRRSGRRVPPPSTSATSHAGLPADRRPSLDGLIHWYGYAHRRRAAAVSASHRSVDSSAQADPRCCSMPFLPASGMSCRPPRGVSNRASTEPIKVIAARGCSGAVWTFDDQRTSGQRADVRIPPRRPPHDHGIRRRRPGPMRRRGAFATRSREDQYPAPHASALPAGSIIFVAHGAPSSWSRHRPSLQRIVGTRNCWPGLQPLRSSSVPARAACA